MKHHPGGTVNRILGGILAALVALQPAMAADESPNIVFSEELATPEAAALQQDLRELGASAFSNFPFVQRVEGHTFVYFSQLKSGQHGKGSIPVVAVRRRGAEQWAFHVLLGRGGQPNRELLQTVQELGVTRKAPLFLREYTLSGHPHVTLQALRAAKGRLRAWSGVEPLAGQSGYFRTGYDDNESWLLEGSSLSGAWEPRSTRGAIRCTPIARDGKLRFSEAAAVQLDGGRWLALTREDSGTARKDRGLYQSESFDDGCTWSKPLRMGDGTQPHILRLDLGDSQSRLVACVGDRTPLGTTAEIGIQCRASSNIAGLDRRSPVTWGPPRMIFKTTHSSDLGQPQSVQVGKTTFETFFYADRGTGTKTDILFVQHRLKDFVLP